jgi:hypothetical protein
MSDDLIAGDQHNAPGYFESRRIVDIHNAILREIGSYSAVTTVLAPLPDRWWQNPAVAQYRAALGEIAAQELQRADGRWAFKDPRTARLLPLWDLVLRDIGANGKCVLTVRHPAEVAQSLARRGDSITAVHSDLLWLDHNADAILHAGERLRCVLDYKRWFDNPVDQAGYLFSSLDIGVAPSGDPLRDILERSVQQPLRHHALEAQSGSKIPFVNDLYAALVARELEQARLIAQIFELAKNFMHSVNAADLSEHGRLLASLNAV